MNAQIFASIQEYSDFIYTCFDRVLLRGYLPIKFAHTKASRKSRGKPTLVGSVRKKSYHSKIDFVEKHYQSQLQQINTQDKVLCIIKSIESAGTFAKKEAKTKQGKPFTKMYSCQKFVNHYYIYLHDKELGLCYTSTALSNVTSSPICGTTMLRPRSATLLWHASNSLVMNHL